MCTRLSGPRSRETRRPLGAAAQCEVKGDDAGSVYVVRLDTRGIQAAILCCGGASAALPVKSAAQPGSTSPGLELHHALCPLLVEDPVMVRGDDMEWLRRCEGLEVRARTAAEAAPQRRLRQRRAAAGGRLAACLPHPLSGEHMHSHKEYIESAAAPVAALLALDGLPRLQARVDAALPACVLAPHIRSGRELSVSTHDAVCCRCSSDLAAKALLQYGVGVTLTSKQCSLRPPHILKPKQRNPSVPRRVTRRSGALRALPPLPSRRHGSAQALHAHARETCGGAAPSTICSTRRPA